MANSTSDDLVCSYDLPGAATTAATAWYKNGAPQMALYMPFEGGQSYALSDYSGNGYSGVAGAGVTWNATAGFDGNGGLEFNGSSSADMRVGYLMSPGAYTKVAWIKRVGDGDNNIISGNTSHILWAPDLYSFRLSSGHNGDWDIVQDSETLEADVWYFVAVTFDSSVNAGQFILYKNGVEVDRATGVPAQNPLDGKIWIGSYAGSYNFNGVIDDVRVYDHPLSSEQIWALHNSGQNLIDATETGVGDAWQADVTPFSSTERGLTAGTWSLGFSLVFGSKAICMVVQ